jgi:hypothetical protein
MNHFACLTIILFSLTPVVLVILALCKAASFSGDVMSKAHWQSPMVSAEEIRQVRRRVISSATTSDAGQPKAGVVQARPRPSI